MTLNVTFQRQSLKTTTQLMQMGWLVLVAAVASLLLAFRHQNGIMLGVVLALATLVVPAGFVLGRRMVEKVRQRETEDRLMTNTRTYLQSQMPARGATDAANKGPAAESDIEILARNIDGRRLPMQDFRKSNGIAVIVPVGEAVVFDALPHQYSSRGFLDRRLAQAAAMLPMPASVPLSELLPAAATPEIEFPAAEECPAIEYAAAVLDEIRLRTVEGFQCTRHGGVEVGGVLFGKRGEGVLRILAVRPIECEYSSGPRFVLSKKDEMGLADLLLASADDSALAGLEPVGYFHSHTREEICLSAVDVQVFNRFFPQPWQVALVVRPANLAPTRAGLFRREANGTIRAASGSCEFLLTPATATAAA